MTATNKEPSRRNKIITTSLEIWIRFLRLQMQYMEM